MPSRHENCLFFLRPMLMSVGDLIAEVQREDPGVTASVLSKGTTLRQSAAHLNDRIFATLVEPFVLQTSLTGCSNQLLCRSARQVG